MIVVEGRYDKNAILQVVDATVLETGGFGVFNDEKLRRLLKTMAGQRGVIVLTDSDGAGFVIRNHLKGILPPEQVKHAFIPDRPGKERRKISPGREGKLGVEGMPPDVLLDALRRAGATFEDEEAPSGASRVTKADFYDWGLSGRPDSAGRRDTLKKALDLPERMSANALFGALAALYGREELEKLVEKLTQDKACSHE